MGETLANTILAKLDQGQFDSVVDAESLVTEVMAVIRTMVPDRHFDFSIRGAPDDYPTPSTSGMSSAHGLKTTRVLDYDTAYLEFDSLPGDSASMSFVEQSLAELPEVRAVIIDIRSNVGGSGDMVVLLCSHLLEAGTLLYEFSDRSDNPPREMKAASYGRRFGPEVPVLVLTSEATLSAAEALAYILQDYDRALIVGEQTPGMANPSRKFSIGEDFEITVPFLLLRYGRSGGTFSGVGVAPDKVVPVESAFDVAMAEISAKLQPTEH
jgi:C-terminal processing protease CtpA/Prc